ncbi:MAG: GAF domain-containing protein [Chloroflexi bacterium]|nr:GAF domain-containing protein [Chloroflexota bacterium]
MKAAHKSDERWVTSGATRATRHAPPDTRHAARDMGDITPLPFAIAAIIVGGGLLLLAWGVARWAASRRPPDVAPSRSSLPVQLRSLDDAVLVARTGGQVLFVNDRARQLFGLNGGEPDLMLMARQADPPESFLELFAAEGQATLEVQTTGPPASTHRVQATSHRFPLDDGPRFVVVLRETGLVPRLTPEDERAAAAVDAIAEIGQAISASLDLEATVGAILASLERVVPYDVGEINLWEPENNWLHTGGRRGNHDYVIALETLGSVCRIDEGYSGWLIRHRRPLLIPDVKQRADIRPKVSPDAVALGGYLGVPLRSADTFIGTIELLSLQSNSFDDSHLRLLGTLAGQAAIAIQNAQLFEAQQQRVDELSGLAEVAQAIGAITDPQEMYGRLTERMANLMRVAMCGFLLYDERAEALVGQLPFYGVPDAFAALYRIQAPPGGPADRLWRDADYWLSNDVLNEPLVGEIGLLDLATSLGVRQALIVPLLLGGRRLGVVQRPSSAPPRRWTTSCARLSKRPRGYSARRWPRSC